MCTHIIETNVHTHTLANFSDLMPMSLSWVVGRKAGITKISTTVLIPSSQGGLRDIRKEGFWSFFLVFVYLFLLLKFFFMRLP